jgi:hypothetical protein
MSVACDDAADEAAPTLDAWHQALYRQGIVPTQLVWADHDSWRSTQWCVPGGEVSVRWRGGAGNVRVSVKPDRAPTYGGWVRAHCSNFASGAGADITFVQLPGRGIWVAARSEVTATREPFVQVATIFTRRTLARCLPVLQKRAVAIAAGEGHAPVKVSSSALRSLPPWLFGVRVNHISIGRAVHSIERQLNDERDSIEPAGWPW